MPLKCPKVETALAGPRRRPDVAAHATRRCRAGDPALPCMRATLDARERFSHAGETSGALAGSSDPFGFAKESAGPQTREPAQVAGRIGLVRLRVFVRAVLAGMRRAGRSAGICRCAAVARSRGRFRRGAPSALIGVVEAASCELDAARGEDLLGLRTALRAAHLRALSHRVLNFKDFTACGATVIIACHTSPNERIAFKQTTVLYPNRSSSNR